MTIPGIRREAINGKTLIDDGHVIVRLFDDCMVIGASTKEGIKRLNTLELKEANNVILYKDGVGAVHTMEVYFDMVTYTNKYL